MFKCLAPVYAVQAQNTGLEVRPPCAVGQWEGVFKKKKQVPGQQQVFREAWEWSVVDTPALRWP